MNEKESQGNAPDAHTKETEDLRQEIVEPNLRTYYEGKKIKLSTWLKALNAVETGGFPEADVVATLRTLMAVDPSLEKTRRLSDILAAPSAVDRWIAQTWRYVLESQFEGAKLDPSASAVGQLTAITVALEPRFRDRDRVGRRFAENFLQISLQQLLEKRELDPGDVLRILNKLFRKDTGLEERALRQAVRHKLLKIKVAHLRDLTLSFAFADAQSTSIRKELADAKNQIASRAAQCDLMKDQLKHADEKLTEKEYRIQELELELERARRLAHDNRQVGAHGQSEIKSRLRAFLTGKLDPLLADAIDAVEIQPVLVDVVRERVGSARTAIRGEVSWLDRPSD